MDDAYVPKKKTTHLLESNEKKERKNKRKKIDEQVKDVKAQAKEIKVSSKKSEVSKKKKEKKVTKKSKDKIKNNIKINNNKTPEVKKKEIMVKSTEKKKGRKKNTRRKEKKSYSIILLIFLFLMGILIYCDINDLNGSRNQSLKVQALINEIKSHYSKTVMVIKDTPIYFFEAGDFVEAGKIYEGNIVNLNDIEINDNTKYFNIANTDYYLSFSDVIPSEKEVVLSDEIESITDEIIVTKKGFTLYKGDEKMYTLDFVMEFPIVKYSNNKYYVEYKGLLLNIREEDTFSIVKDM